MFFSSLLAIDNNQMRREPPLLAVVDSIAVFHTEAQAALSKAEWQSIELLPNYYLA
jgi:hypothetical protein